MTEDKITELNKRLEEVKEKFDTNKKRDFDNEIKTIKNSIGDFQFKSLPKMSNQPTPSKSEIPEISEEEKEEYIKRFKQDEVAKKNKIGIVDETKEKPVKKKTYGWMKFFTALGIIALAIFTCAIALFAYLAYGDGTLLPEPSVLICGNTTINVEPTKCPDCPAIPKCPEPPNIKVYCNQTNG